jgi:hypothetical protein
MIFGIQRTPPLKLQKWPDGLKQFEVSALRPLLNLFPKTINAAPKIIPAH